MMLDAGCLILENTNLMQDSRYRIQVKISYVLHVIHLDIGTTVKSLMNILLLASCALCPATCNQNSVWTYS